MNNTDIIQSIERSLSELNAEVLRQFHLKGEIDLDLIMRRVNVQSALLDQYRELFKTQEQYLQKAG